MTARLVAAAVALTVTLAGPLAPYSVAQQPSQQAPSPSRPELFQEQLKAVPDAERNRGLYTAGAVAVNVFHVPGRAITCTLGGLTAGAVLLLTLGSAYRAASGVMHEGCGGKWIVTGDDLRPESDGSGWFPGRP
jgi:hypothetical protein